VHEIAGDGDGDAVPGRLCLNGAELAVVAVGQGDPGAAVLRVAGSYSG